MHKRFVRRIRDGAWLDTVFASDGEITTDPVSVAADLSAAHGEPVELIDTDGSDPRTGELIPLTDKPVVLRQRIALVVDPEAIKSATTLAELKAALLA